jgi:hypothetical protein
MAKLFCALAVLVPLLAGSQQPTPSRDNADVVILRYSWNRFTQQPRAVTPSVPNGTTTTNAQDQRAEDTERMSRADSDLARTHQGYAYKIRFRNAGAKTVTALLWDYQFGAQSGPQEISHHQFLCLTGVKPGAAASLEAFSPSPPTSVVSATSAGQKEGQGADSRVVVNRVEYSDGTAWERDGWARPNKDRAYHADLYQTLPRSKCLGF